MMFIPYKRIEILTSLTIGEIVDRLGMNVDTRTPIWWWPWRPRAMYRGTVSHDGFQIVRSISGRNTYLPLITGRFTHLDGNTIVAIRLTLRPAAIVILAALTSLVVVLSVRASDGCACGVIAGLVVCHCGMNLFGFYPEERRSIRWLCELLSSSDTPM